MKRKICIDAGHYGVYNPSPVERSYVEAQVMWKLHLMLKEQLEKQGFDVVVTRKNQAIDLPLGERGRMALGCVGFVSLHSNAADSPEPNWAVAMHFIEDSRTDLDEQSKALGDLLAKTVGDTMGVGYEIFSRVSSQDRDGDGRQDDYYGVLRGARSVGVPGVLLEHGFHTNPGNARWLLEDGNLRKLAEREAEVLALFFGAFKMIGMELPVLKKGAKGEPVRAMQMLLLGNGYTLDLDGSFGVKTENALMSYQEDKSLMPDGSCGRKTWTALLGL